MLILLSPAKSLDFESPLPTRKHTEPRLLPESQRLIEVMDFRKLSTDDNKLVTASKATQHLYIVNPFRKLGADSLFSTHPSLESRIAALRGLATGGEAPGSSE